MRTDRKREINRLAGELQRSNNPESRTVKELLGLLVEDAKDSLVASQGNETIRLQGEAQAFTRLLGMVTKAPISIQRAQGDNQ